MTVTCCFLRYLSPLQLQQMEDSDKMPLRIQVCTDCRSVYDALSAEDTKTPSESSLILILHVLKELLRARIIHKLTWVHTDDMLADGLTKGGVSRKALFEFSKTGRWNLQHPTKTFIEKPFQQVSQSFLMQISQGLAHITGFWIR